MSFLKAENIEKKYSSNIGIGPISMLLEKNKIYSLIGPNASGKTTLIRCLCFLEKLDSGSITINETKENNQLITSVVFQQPEPWPHLTVLENVMLPLIHVAKYNKKDARLLAEETLANFGLLDRIKYFPHQLSGGLRQRVVHTRTFAMKPKYLFLDEPTSALDPEWTEQLGKLLKNYASDGNMVFIVAHQINFLKKISDIVYFIKNGLILEEGHPSQVLGHPSNESLQKFLENA